MCFLNRPELAPGSDSQTFIYRPVGVAMSNCDKFDGVVIVLEGLSTSLLLLTCDI